MINNVKDERQTQHRKESYVKKKKKGHLNGRLKLKCRRGKKKETNYVFFCRF